MFTDENDTEIETTEIIPSGPAPDGGTANNFAEIAYDETLYDHYADKEKVPPVDEEVVQARKDLLAGFTDLYYERGWCVAPAPPTYDPDLGKYVVNKGPRTKGWTTNRLTADEVKSKLVGYSHGLPENIVIPTGVLSGNLIGVDLDSAEAYNAWEEIERAKNLKTKMERKRASAPKRGQKFYQVESPLALKRYAHPGGGEEMMHVELLGDRACSMAPGSIHPKTNETMYWKGEMPDCLVPTQVKAADLAFAVKLCATAAMFGRIWKDIEGKHGLTTLALMGVLARNGVSKDDAKLLAKAIVAAGGDKLDKRLKAVEDTYENLAAGLPTTGLPKLSELVRQDVVTSLCSWWGIKDRAEVSANSLAASTASSTPAAKAKADPWYPCNMRTWLTTAPPAPEWIFTDVMVRGIVAGFSAAGGTGKSIVMLELATSAAIGRTLLPLFKPVAPLKVMFFPGEDPEQVTWRRFDAVKNWARLSAAEEKLLEANLLVYPYTAEPLLAPDDGALKPTARYYWFKEEVDRQRPDLMMLDPKSRWIAADENSNDHATRFVTMLEALVRPHNASVLVTHHVNKTKQDTPTIHSARGASAFGDATRLFFNMLRLDSRSDLHPNPTDKSNNYLALGITKSNYSATTPQPVVLRQLLAKDGVIEQYDGPVSKLRDIVDAIAAEIAIRGPINQSGITDPHKEEIEFVEAVRARISCTGAQRKEALAWGIENGFLVATIDTSGGGGRKATIISLPVIVTPVAIEDSSMAWLDDLAVGDLDDDDSAVDSADEHLSDESELTFA